MPAPLDHVFAALSDPTRRHILAMLLEDDMAVTDVAAPFAMSLAAISKHLKILAAADLIEQERRGRVIWCKLNPGGLYAATVWMEGFGLFAPVDLERLEALLRLDDPGEAENDDDDHDQADDVEDIAHGSGSWALEQVDDGDDHDHEADDDKNGANHVGTP